MALYLLQRAAANLLGRTSCFAYWFVFGFFRPAFYFHNFTHAEAPINPRQNRERTAEIFFETFNVPALYISIQAVLSLYATGRTTGIVLDSGDGVTQAVPIYEGFALPLAITRSDVAGRDVSRYLKFLLRKEGLIFNTTAEFEIVKTIKEKICFLTSNPSRAYDDRTISGAGSELENTSYMLPDGRSVDIGVNPRLRAPEILFRPDIIGHEFEGVHEILVSSIEKSDMDLRKILYQNIVLSGGSTLFKGFGDRLLNEVKKIASKDLKIRISAPQERLYSTWIGGSILASLESFKRMWISRNEYDEEGLRIVNKKIF